MLGCCDGFSHGKGEKAAPASANRCPLTGRVEEIDELPDPVGLAGGSGPAKPTCQKRSPARASTTPQTRGLEARIAEKLERLRALNAQTPSSATQSPELQAQLRRHPLGCPSPGLALAMQMRQR